MEKKTTRDKSSENIEAVVLSLLKLKGMFGAVIHLINPDGTNVGYPFEHFENWFMDVRDKLDEAINMLNET